MKSSYSIRLYQLLQCWAFKGERVISLDELRLCLGCREVDEEGNILKDSLLPYKNFKRVALSPAVEEVNEKSDLSVSFREEKLPGSKSIGAIRFLIRRNVETANRFGELPSPTLSAVEPDQQAQLDAIAEEMGLSAKQVGTLADYVQKDGLDYVLEKAEIARKQPNPAAAFIKALREDWKKPAPKASDKPKPRPKAPLSPWRDCGPGRASYNARRGLKIISCARRLRRTASDRGPYSWPAYTVLPNQLRMEQFS
jgi:plasmid replication initiation protein